MAHFTNKLELEFINKYFEGNAITPQSIKKYYKQFQDNVFNTTGEWGSLYVEFNKFLEERHSSVPETEFIDFKTRFTYLRKNDNTLFLTKQPATGEWHFSRGEIIKEIGYLKENNIYDLLGSVLALGTGSVNTYHYYNWGGMFAGIPNEILCQMPSELKNDKSYYYTYTYIEERFETHHVKLDFYEIIV